MPVHTTLLILYIINAQPGMMISSTSPLFCILSQFVHLGINLQAGSPFSEQSPVRSSVDGQNSAVEDLAEYVVNFYDKIAICFSKGIFIV